MIPAANVSDLALSCNKVQFLQLAQVVGPCSLILAVDLKEQDIVIEELLTTA